MNPFISLLAGVAGAAVYDHLKDRRLKGGAAKYPMAKKVTLGTKLFPPRDGNRAVYSSYVAETYQPLLDQLESEAQMAAQAGDEGAYYAASLELDNVQGLMNGLVQKLTSGCDSAIRIHENLNDIAEGIRPFSGYM